MTELLNYDHYLSIGNLRHLNHRALLHRVLLFLVVVLDGVTEGVFVDFLDPIVGVVLLKVEYLGFAGRVIVVLGALVVHRALKAAGLLLIAESGPHVDVLLYLDLVLHLHVDVLIAGALVPHFSRLMSGGGPSF